MISLTNHDSRVREDSEVVIIYPDSCNVGPKTDRSQICSCRYKMVEVSRPTIGLMVHRLLQSGENYADLQHV